MKERNHTQTKNKGVHSGICRKSVLCSVFAKYVLKKKDIPDHVLMRLEITSEKAHKECQNWPRNFLEIHSASGSTAS